MRAVMPAVTLLRRRFLFAAACCGLLLCTGSLQDRHPEPSVKTPQRRQNPGRIATNRLSPEFQILAINDFHGWIVSGKEFHGRPAGGAAVLASHLRAAGAPFGKHSVIVHAGDLIGASPAESALLGDEPAFGFMNLLAARRPSGSGLPPVICVPGNHEFDYGVEALFRLIRGNPEKPDAHDRGARFPFICANIVDSLTSRPLFDPSVTATVDGITVAFVGATVRETPSMVTHGMVSGIRFDDEADAINAQVRRLVGHGIRAIIAVIHQGGRQEYYPGWTNAAAPPPTGPIVDIVSRLHDEVDVVVTGHTHSFTNAFVGNAGGAPVLVVQALPHGMGYADIRIVLDRESGNVANARARVEPARADEGPGLTPDRQVAALTARALERVGPSIRKKVGRAGARICATPDSTGESALDNLVADAHRHALRAEISFMNPGGLRAAIDSGDIEFRNVFNVHPFGNHLIEMAAKGAVIREILEQQWTGRSGARILQVSGVSYTWDDARAEGNRTFGISINAEPLDSARDYRVAVNEFLAGGGDGFTAFRKATRISQGIVDREALRAFLEESATPVMPAPRGRIRRENTEMRESAKD